MDAGDMRRHIALVESYNREISEVDSTRRGLFKGAAALAAVAALPPQVKTQAVELIKDHGTELLQAAIDAVKHGVDQSDISWVREMAVEWMYGTTEDRPLDMFPSNKYGDAVRSITGIDDPRSDAARARLDDILSGMHPDKLFELLRKTWKDVGLGDDPSWYHYYQMTKRYPNVIDNDDPDGTWDLLRDFLPADRRQPGFFPDVDHHSLPISGLDRIIDSLEYAREDLAQSPNDPELRAEVARLEKLVKDHQAAQKHLGTQAPQMSQERLAALLDDARNRLQDRLNAIENLKRNITNPSAHWDQATRERNAAYARKEIARIKERDIPERQAKIDRILELAKRYGFDLDAKSSAAQQVSRTPSPSAPPAASPAVGTKQMLTPVLRAVDTILNAFKRVDKVSNAALEIIKDVKPGNVQVTLQRDAGQEPQAPQQPAALPAPEPGIDIGLDRQRQPVDAPKKP